MDPQKMYTLLLWGNLGIYFWPHYAMWAVGFSKFVSYSGWQIEFGPFEIVWG